MAKKEKKSVKAEKLSSRSDYSKFFEDSFGISPYPEFDNSEEKEYDIHIVSSPASAKEGILTEKNIREKLNDLIDSTDESLLEAAFKAVQSVVGEAAPSIAPTLWKDRDRSKKMKCTDFILDVYKPWIGKGLRRHHLKKIDAQLYQTLGAFFARNGVPKKLESLENADEKITLEFLEERGIAEPKDALRVFKNDPREAQRVYAAALRKLNK